MNIQGVVELFDKSNNFFLLDILNFFFLLLLLATLKILFQAILLLKNLIFEVYKTILN